MLKFVDRLVTGLFALTLFAVAAFAQSGPFSAPGAGGQNPSSSASAQTLMNSKAAPAGTASTTFVMLGMGANGAVMAPTYSGLVYVQIMFNHTSSVATDGGDVQCVFGTGTPPANGAAPVGTSIGSHRTFTAGTTTATVEHGICGGIVQLTTSQTYWFDVQFKAVTGGTYTLTNVDVEAFEIG